MNRINEVRKQHGMKQSDMAKSLGVAKSTISGYCNNMLQPSFSKLIKIAKLFNCEVSDLIDMKK